MINKKIEVPKAVSKTESMFYNELRDFKGEEVTITLLNGNIIHAKILAMEFKDLNFIIEYKDGIKEMIRGGAIQGVRLGTKIEKNDKWLFLQLKIILVLEWYFLFITHYNAYNSSINIFNIFLKI